MLSRKHGRHTIASTEFSGIGERSCRLSPEARPGTCPRPPSAPRKFLHASRRPATWPTPEIDRKSGRWRGLPTDLALEQDGLRRPQERRSPQGPDRLIENVREGERLHSPAANGHRAGFSASSAYLSAWPSRSSMLKALRLGLRRRRRSPWSTFATLRRNVALPHDRTTFRPTARRPFRHLPGRFDTTIRRHCRRQTSGEGRLQRRCPDSPNLLWATRLQFGGHA